jgi:hypothetical protein
MLVAPQPQVVWDSDQARPASIESTKVGVVPPSLVKAICDADFEHCVHAAAGEQRIRIVFASRPVVSVMRLAARHAF